MSIHWKYLKTSDDLDEALAKSGITDIVILKHSTTCSISLMAKMRFEEKWDFAEDKLIPYYVDVKEHRNISMLIAEKLSVNHESPQLLLIRNKECIYDASHFDITVDELKESILWHDASTADH